MALALCFSSSFRFSWADTVGDPDFVPLDVVSVSYSTSSYSTDSDFTECESFLSEDGFLVFKIPKVESPSIGRVYLRVELASGTVLSSGAYLTYEMYSSSSDPDYSFFEYYGQGPAGGISTPFESFVSIPRSSSYSPSGSVNVYSGQFGYTPLLTYNNSLTLFSTYEYNLPTPDILISRFCLSTKPYYDGAFDPEPGWDEEDGWLGSLIKAIIEGIQKIIDGITNLPENIANAVKGFFDMVVNAIVQLGQTILDGLKSLFIPSDGYFEGVASDMQAWLEDHLGLLVYPFTLVADLASRIAAVEGGEPTAHIPEIAYTDGGDKYVLIAEQEVNLYDQVGRNETFIELHQLYLMAMDAAIGGALAFLAWKKFDQITGGSST